MFFKSEDEVIERKEIVRILKIPLDENEIELARTRIKELKPI